MVCLGLGSLPILCLGDYKKNRLGVQAFLGLILTPLILSILNLIFRIPLDLASIGVSWVGATLFVVYTATNYRKMLGEILHPILLGGVFLSILFGVIGPQSYFAHHWDEFTQWLTMPKQMFLHKEIFSPDFLVKTFYSYLPAWPLQLIFHDLVFGLEFRPIHGLYAVLVSSIFTWGALYDLLNVERSKKLLVSFFLVVAVFYMRFLPSHVLIEFSLYHVHIVLFLYLAQTIQTPTSGFQMRCRWLVLGLLLSYAYWAKQTSMTLVPILALAPLLSERSWPSKVKSSILILIPFVGFYFLWKWHLSEHRVDALFSAVPPLSGSQLLDRLQERGIIFLTMFRKLWSSFFAMSILEMLAFIYFFYSSGKSVLKHPLKRLVILFGVLYLGALMWMYLTAFSDGEARGLASFGRYMSIPYLMISLFGAIEFLTSIRFWSKVIVFPILILMTAIGFYRIKTPETEMEKAVPTLMSAIKNHGMNQPKVMIIAQGGQRMEAYVAQYLSIGSDGYLFTVDGSGTSFGEIADNTWRTVVTRDQFLQILEKNDILWIQKSDPWLETVLRSVPSLSECPNPFSDYFLFKSNGGWECVPR